MAAIVSIRSDATGASELYTKVSVQSPSTIVSIRSDATGASERESIMTACSSGGVSIRSDATGASEHDLVNMVGLDANICFYSL